MADKANTGTLNIHIGVQSALADRGVILRRMLTLAVYRTHFGNTVPAGQSINPQNETWVLYIPPQYDGTKAYGVLVCISPGDDASLPYGWRGALDSHKIIYIAAGRSGNEQPVYDRRVPLALTGYSYVLDHYRVDKNRVYVGGFSGGGVVASHIASAFVDIFSGGLFVSTAVSGRCASPIDASSTMTLCPGANFAPLRTLRRATFAVATTGASPRRFALPRPIESCRPYRQRIYRHWG